MTMIASPVETIDAAKQGLLKKAHADLATMVISALFAGAMIAMGFIFYVTSQVGWAGFPTGLAKVLGGVVFSTGLGLVIITGADLFTSTSMTTFLVKEKALTVGAMLRHWAIVYLSNMMGAFFMALLIFFGGVAHQSHGGWGAVVLQVAVSKTSHSAVESICLGILCNVMVCLAVWLAFAGKTLVDKIVAVAFPIALFVASSFEHSVANMFMIPLALMLKAQGDPTVLEAVAGTDVSGLTVSSYLLHNLLPVTVGNIIGGSVVALGMAYWHRNRVTLATQ
ncbi:formate/nitrite transporter family protein [Corynebacterium hindlerae]|uniref:Formate/nitrite transporter family protein n=1 Tax=Corynebacterium hindlerae TaxID=699041 RepID=A0A7G5FF23_9CORY|nr:formate/nitrite transporter family protein [Corynebacterium hindlerae]QMV85214.1 formate/nitrite transporter family protein [Corynebacterium hindlerae]